MEESIQYAKKYLEDLLSFFGLNTDVYATAEDDEVIELHVPSTQYNGFLIGQHGDTIRALQYMVSTALKSQGHAVYRVNVDVAEYKKARADRLLQKAAVWVKQVKDSQELMHLSPMNAADRRLIHKLAGEEGLLTESEGEGRERHVVLRAAQGSVSSEQEAEDAEHEALSTKHEAALEGLEDDEGKQIVVKKPAEKTKAKKAAPKKATAKKSVKKAKK